MPQDESSEDVDGDNYDEKQLSPLFIVEILNV